MYRLFRPLLFKLGEEQAHRMSMGAARLVQAVKPAAIEPLFAFEHEALRQTCWGLDFHNPVGLAAGFDKNARLTRFWQAVGFGFAEVGSVSAQPAEGNPRPRAFRLPGDRAIINRMGLNNEGAEKIAKRLQQRPQEDLAPLGVNLAKTHDPDVMGAAAVDDFRRSFRILAPLADYVALNISCPNTTEGKTFEDPAALETLLSAVFTEREAMDLDVPVLLKLSPPVSEHVVFDSAMEETLSLAEQYGVQGYIATNTTSDRTGLRTSKKELDKIGRGGLSGKPLEKRATRLVRQIYQKTKGKHPIIGVGGVDSAPSAYAKIRAGASLVQLYTALVYEGPGLVKRVKRNLVRLLKADGFSSLREAVGADA